jgi:hypothetical protein
MIPSPDATSVFLVGSFAERRVRLPRGDYELTLNFNTQLSGLPRLHPNSEKVSLSGTSETAMLKFIQPSGQRWPAAVSPPDGFSRIDWSRVDIRVDQFTPEDLHDPRPPDSSIYWQRVINVILPGSTLTELVNGVADGRELAQVVSRLQIVSQHFLSLPEIARAKYPIIHALVLTNTVLTDMETGGH